MALQVPAGLRGSGALSDVDARQRLLRQSKSEQVEQQAVVDVHARAPVSIDSSGITSKSCRTVALGAASPLGSSAS